jgi:hypothetical protein
LLEENINMKINGIIVVSIGKINLEECFIFQSTHSGARAPENIL